LEWRKPRLIVDSGSQVYVKLIGRHTTIRASDSQDAQCRSVVLVCFEIGARSRGATTSTIGDE